MIIASVVIPARAARSQSAHEGLRKLVIQLLICELVYLILVTQIWVRL